MLERKHSAALKSVRVTGIEMFVRRDKVCRSERYTVVRANAIMSGSSRVSRAPTAMSFNVQANRPQRLTEVASGV